MRRPKSSRFLSLTGATARPDVLQHRLVATLRGAGLVGQYPSVLGFRAHKVHAPLEGKEGYELNLIASRVEITHGNWAE